MPDLPASLVETKDNWTVTASLYFYIQTVDQAGLYELYLHNCEKPARILFGKVEDFWLLFFYSYYLEKISAKLL